ncbi:MAG: endoglucanase [Bacteroidetes bacterium QS_9_68_14]|nr:MAG: endoglucanase [Bacteroidetes bacterium QS_9_68_14]
MTDAARDFLFELLQTPSPTGFEMPGQRVWAGYLDGVADRVETNTYGSTFAVLEGSGGSGNGGEEAPRLMLDAHADEIGLMVRHITDEGFLHVAPIGGSDRKISQARRVHVLTEDGEKIPGVTGHTAIHLRDRKNDDVPEWEDIYIDIGADDADEVRERGVRVGRPVVSAEGPEQVTDDRLVGRALDNRLGGFVIAETLRRLSEGDRPEATVIAANSVQEEIGGYGAAMAAFELEPSVALAFDVTHATDTPGLNPAEHGKVEMGEGPSVTHGTSAHPRVVKRLMSVAEDENLALQHEASSRRTGTDTDAIFRQRSGTPSGLMSVPLRYMHSMSELVDLGDLEQCVKLQVAFARSLSAGDTFRTEL